MNDESKIKTYIFEWARRRFSDLVVQRKNGGVHGQAKMNYWDSGEILNINDLMIFLRGQWSNVAFVCPGTCPWRKGNILPFFFADSRGIGGEYRALTVRKLGALREKRSTLENRMMNAPRMKRS